MNSILVQITIRIEHKTIHVIWNQREIFLNKIFLFSELQSFSYRKKRRICAHKPLEKPRHWHVRRLGAPQTNSLLLAMEMSLRETSVAEEDILDNGLARRPDSPTKGWEWCLSYANLTFLSLWRIGRQSFRWWKGQLFWSGVAMSIMLCVCLGILSKTVGYLRVRPLCLPSVTWRCWLAFFDGVQIFRVAHETHDCGVMEHFAGCFLNTFSC